MPRRLLQPKIDTSVLEREAPETLIEPKREQFDTEANYQIALQKFREVGHWATPATVPKETERKLFEISPELEREAPFVPFAPLEKPELDVFAAEKPEPEAVKKAPWYIKYPYRIGKKLGLEELGKGIAISLSMTPDVGEFGFKGVKAIQEEMEKSKTIMENNLLTAIKDARAVGDTEKAKRYVDVLQDVTQHAEGAIAAVMKDAPSTKELIGSAINLATLAAFGLKPSPKVVGRLAYGAALGGAFGLAKGYTKEGKRVGVSEYTFKEVLPTLDIGKHMVVGAAIGLGTAGIFEGLGALLRKWVSHSQKTKEIAGKAYTKILKPKTKELTREIEFGMKTIGQKVQEAGYYGNQKKMYQQAVKNIATYSDELDDLLRQFPDVKINRTQVLGDAIEELSDRFGSLIKREDQVILNEIAKIPKSMNLTKLQEVKRLLDKKIDPSFWIEQSHRKAFPNFVRHTLRTNIKHLIEEATGGAARMVNQKLGLALDVRHLASEQLSRIAKFGMPSVPFGTKTSLFWKLLQKSVFSPTVVTGFYRRLTSLGEKTGQTLLRQLGRLGIIRSGIEISDLIMEDRE